MSLPQEEPVPVAEFIELSTMKWESYSAASSKRMMSSWTDVELKLVKLKLVGWACTKGWSEAKLVKLITRKLVITTTQYLKPDLNEDIAIQVPTRRTSTIKFLQHYLVRSNCIGFLQLQMDTEKEIPAYGDRRSEHPAGSF
jgi:hypothetical protein